MITNRIGADPEVFLQDQSGKFISSVGLFGGTKKNPKPMIDLPPGFFFQEDNVTLEFNIPPTNSVQQFVENIYTALEFLVKEASKHNLKIVITSSVVFEKDQLEHPRARVFGCERDFNVWSRRYNPAPKAKNPLLRSGGGHAHLEVFNVDKIELGRACDLFSGCPSILVDHGVDRRLLYGKAGAIRDKPYGIEYRTLSNFWLKETSYTEMIFNQLQQAIKFVQSGKKIDKIDNYKIIKCINLGNQELLKELTAKYDLQY